MKRLKNCENNNNIQKVLDLQGLRIIVNGNHENEK